MKKSTLIIGAFALILLPWISAYFGGQWGSNLRRAWVEAQGDPIRSNEMFSDYDLSSTTFVYNESAGAGVDDGWFTVATERERAIQVDIATLNATSVEFVIEGRLRGESAAAQIWPSTGDRSETATGSFIVYIPDAIYQVRLGMKITGDSGTQSIDGTLNTYAPDSR